MWQSLALCTCLFEKEHYKLVKVWIFEPSVWHCIVCLQQVSFCCWMNVLKWNKWKPWYLESDIGHFQEIMWTIWAIWNWALMLICVIITPLSNNIQYQHCLVVWYMITYCTERWVFYTDVFSGAQIWCPTFFILTTDAEFSYSFVCALCQGYYISHSRCMCARCSVLQLSVICDHDSSLEKIVHKSQMSSLVESQVLT